MKLNQVAPMPMENNSRVGIEMSDIVGEKTQELKKKNNEINVNSASDSDSDDGEIEPQSLKVGKTASSKFTTKTASGGPSGAIITGEGKQLKPRSQDRKFSSLALNSLTSRLRKKNNMMGTRARTGTDNEPINSARENENENMVEKMKKRISDSRLLSTIVEAHEIDGLSNRENSVSQKQILRAKEKIERVDRVRGLLIIYPPFMVPAQGKFKLYWDIFLMITVLWLAISLPWEIAFPEDSILVQNYIIFTIFIIDIGINLRTTFFDEENDEIVHWKPCAIKYMKSPNFVLDLVSSLPIDLFTEGSGDQRNPYISLLKFFKILRLLRLGKLLKHLKSESFRVFGQLIKSFLVFMLILHWFTLMWFTLVSRQAPEDRNANNVWLPSNYRIIASSSNLDEDALARDFYGQSYSQTDIYIYTFYSMMMSILGGEVAPVEPEQALCASTITFLGQMTIAFIFAEISHILFKMNERKAKYEKAQSRLEDLISTHNLSKEVRNKAMEYFEFCWRKQVIFDKELNDFSGLSKTLQRECLVCIHQDIIMNVPLFSKLEMYEILAIINCLKTQVYMPSESVFKEEEYVSQMYFVTEGVLEIEKINNEGLNDLIEEEADNEEDDEEPEKEPSTPKTNKREKFYLTDHDFFGELAILGNWQAEYGIRSVVFSILQVFTKQDFNLLKKEYPEMERRLRAGYRGIKQEFEHEELPRLKKLPLFKNCLDHEILEVYQEYMQDAYLHSESIVMVPNESVNAFYYVYSGTISVYNIDLKEVKDSDGINNFTDVLECVDDEIYQIIDFSGQNEVQRFLKGAENVIAQINPGQSFGEFQVENQPSELNLFYYVCESQCHLGVLTNTIIETLRQNQPELYEKISNNMREIEHHFMPESLIEKTDNFAFLRKNQDNRALDQPQNFDEMPLDQKLNGIASLLQQQLKQISQLQQNLRVMKYD